MSGLREEITRTFHRLSRGALLPAPARPAALDKTLVPMDSREGRHFGSYRIVKRLGSGGMGDVYLALDTRLGRHTALKFLPPELLSDGSMLQRLEQEARAASALNHPNILTIYEIGQFEGEQFIASEFVEGITLRKAIERKAVDPEMAIYVAVQIASALTAAHSAGVIHRDLKPANIMIRPDGYVKVIDFGLAKLTEESVAGKTTKPALSSPGLVVGTVEYMSPEQARGEEVDPRTDLWSLGVLLYELLTNQRPFGGETPSHIIVAILDRPVPALRNVPSLSPAAAKVIQRALMKDPARRYQSAQEMLADLEQLGPASSRLRGYKPAPRPRQASSRRSAFITTGLLALFVSVWAIWWFRLGGRELLAEPDWIKIDSVKQLTFNGRTLLSALSPDGKYLAFTVGDAGGMQALHVKQVDQPSDEVRIPSRKIDYLGLTFSPDGRNIYEVEENESDLMGKLFVVPLLGDRPTIPLIEDIDGPVAFSPSGDQYAFVRRRSLPSAARNGTESTVQLVSKQNVEPVPLLTTSRFTVFKRLAWSPQGNTIAAVIEDSTAAQDRLYLDLIKLDKTQLRKLLPNWNSVGQIWWTKDGDSVLLSASSATEAKSQSQIREYALKSEKAHDLTKDLGGYRSLTMSQDNQELAAVKVDSRATIWLSDPNDFVHGQSVMSEMQDSAGLAWSNRDDLIVNSRRTGYPNLSVFHSANSEHSTLTDEPFMEQYAAVVPGGQSVLFSSNRSGGFHLWRYDIRPGKYTQLTFGSSYDTTPAVSPDGKWIVYTAWSSTNPLLFKLPIDGGTPVSLGNTAAASAQISPDGKWIACRMQNAAHRWFIAIRPFNTEAPVKPQPNAHLPFRWSPAGDSLISAITNQTGVSNLWRIPLNGAAPTQLTRFDDQSILTFAWSPDGDRLACLRLAQGSDVVLFKR